MNRDASNRRWIGGMALVALTAGACAGVKTAAEEPDGRPPPADTAGPPPVDGGARDGATPASYVVYAHTVDKLYAVDPETLTVNLVGPFLRRNDSGALQPLRGVTDIAVDHDGGLVGLTFTEVLRIDGRTAECTPLAVVQGNHQYNGLSWVTTATGEILLATAGDGTVWLIDPKTGAATSVGAMGAGMTSSGDLVSVTKYGTLATIKRDGMTTDWLARLDPATGAATPIGNIGFTNVWGIGFWKDRVFGFDQSGQFILINPDTGAGTLSQRFMDLNWWGAGVSTSVFVIP